jgi:hypothetical protein
MNLAETSFCEFLEPFKHVAKPTLGHTHTEKEHYEREEKGMGGTRERVETLIHLQIRCFSSFLASPPFRLCKGCERWLFFFLLSHSNTLHVFLMLLRINGLCAHKHTHRYSFSFVFPAFFFPTSHKFPFSLCCGVAEHNSTHSAHIWKEEAREHGRNKRAAYPPS